MSESPRRAAFDADKNLDEIVWTCLVSSCRFLGGPEIRLCRRVRRRGCIRSMVSTVLLGPSPAGR